MSRFAVLVGISLLVYGASSVPRSAWEKVDDTAVQETLMSEGKLGAGLKEEVEPPQDMDVPDVDVDPSMPIWKAVQETRRRAIEEARAHAHTHLAHAHTHAHAGSLMPAPAPSVQQPGARGGGRFQQAEQDMDEVFHHFPDAAAPADQWVEEEAEEEAEEAESLQLGPDASRGRYEQAEVDLDHVYHADKGQVQVHTQVQVGQEHMSMPGQRGRSLPEEDMDDLYHKY